MATLLYRLGKTVFRRWPLFLTGWIIAVLAVGAFATTMSKPMTDAFSIPGIPSEKAADLQAELFPDAKNAFDQAGVKVVVAAPEGSKLSDPEFADRVDALLKDLGAMPQMPEAELAGPVQRRRHRRTRSCRPPRTPERRSLPPVPTQRHCRRSARTDGSAPSPGSTPSTRSPTSSPPRSTP